MKLFFGSVCFVSCGLTYKLPKGELSTFHCRVSIDSICPNLVCSGSIVGLVTGVVLLGIIAGWQTYQLYALQQSSTHILNELVPTQLALIDHFDCSELKGFQGYLTTYGDNGNLSSTLSQEVQKNLNDKC